MLLACSLLVTATLFAQPVISDSTYLRMGNRSKAIEAMRFDLKSYRDTIRSYRDALDAAVTSIDASTPQAEDKRARIGRLRTDLNTLEKEMKRARKRTKSTSTTPLELLAHSCAGSIQRVGTLRSNILAEHVKLVP